MPFWLPDLLRFEIQERWERLKQRWERLVARKWINANPGIIISITAASVLILLVIVIALLIPEKTIKVNEYKKAWFYDLNTGKLFVARSSLVPPIEAPSGPMPNGRPAGLKAYVFSYAYEPNESERFIGFLEIPDPNAENHESVSTIAATRGAEQWGHGRLIRRVEDKNWTPADSKEGRAIMREVFLPNEAGERAGYCPPP